MFLPGRFTPPTIQIISIVVFICKLGIPPLVQPRREDDVIDRRCGTIDVGEEIPHHIFDAWVRGFPDAGSIPSTPTERNSVDQFIDVRRFHQDACSITFREFRRVRNTFPPRTTVRGTCLQFTSGSIDNTEATKRFHPIGLGITPILHPWEPRFLSCCCISLDTTVVISPSDPHFRAINKDGFPTPWWSIANSTTARDKVVCGATICGVGPQFLPNIHAMFESYPDTRFECLLIKKVSLLNTFSLISRSPRGIHEFGNPWIECPTPRAWEDANSKIIRNAIIVEIGPVVELGQFYDILPRVRQWQAIAF